MARCYIDTNFLYVHLRETEAGADPAVAAWRDRVEREIGDDVGVISGLVLDELTHRLILAWLREDGETDPLTTFRRSTMAVMTRMRSRLARLWKAIDALDLEFAVTDRGVTHRAMELMSDPGLPPRDAFHAAHALDCGCQVIVSSDAGYDLLAEPTRLGPPPVQSGKNA
jgi:predicted nucleic acid-binding protein